MDQIKSFFGFADTKKSKNPKRPKRTGDKGCKERLEAEIPRYNPKFMYFKGSGTNVVYKRPLGRGEGRKSQAFRLAESEPGRLYYARGDGNFYSMKIPKRGKRS